jgi:hypothetical protein
LPPTIARRQRAELCQMQPANATAQRGGLISRLTGPDRRIGARISLKWPGIAENALQSGSWRGQTSSTDCKSGFQAPIRAGKC